MSKPTAMVVGAGAGGLVAALYLQRAGHDVLLLEAKSRVGGCASTFPIDDFRFLAGATTLMGLEADMPLGIVLRELDVPPIEAEPYPLARKNISVWHGGRHFTLTREREENEFVLRDFFGPRFAGFWRDSTTLGASAWRVLTRLHFPPRGPGDLLGAATDTGAWSLLPSLLQTTASRVGNVGGDARRVLDELLLVSTQATSERTPWLFGALGIEYLQRPLLQLTGGLPSLLEHLARVFVARGGTLQLDAPVSSFSRHGAGFRVATKTQTHDAERLVLNLTHWDAARLASPELAPVFAGVVKRHPDAWATCTLYLGIEDVFGGDAAPYHQLIFDTPLPSIGAHSAFATISRSDDTTVAPRGFRAVTMSTHARAEDWRGLDDVAHRSRKASVVNELVEALSHAFPAVRDAKRVVALPGTPKTWEGFTGRSQGRVGGLPFDFATLRRGFPTGRTRVPGLVRVGDTVFPGQSVPACAWGARRVVLELLDAT